MKHNVTLTIASLLSILFVTFHLTDDIVRGMEPGTLSNLIAVPILVVWLCGTLLLNERLSGLIIMLVGSLLTLVIPVVHVMAAEGIFHGAIARSSPAFLFVWTLHAMGVLGMFSFILAVRALWQRQKLTADEH